MDEGYDVDASRVVIIIVTTKHEIWVWKGWYLSTSI